MWAGLSEIKGIIFIYLTNIQQTADWQLHKLYNSLRPFQIFFSFKKPSASFGACAQNKTIEKLFVKYGGSDNDTNGVYSFFQANQKRGWHTSKNSPLQTVRIKEQIWQFQREFCQTHLYFPMFVWIQTRLVKPSFQIMVGHFFDFNDCYWKYITIETRLKRLIFYIVKFKNIKLGLYQI
jgi:hypothetical protein